MEIEKMTKRENFDEQMSRLRFRSTLDYVSGAPSTLLGMTLLGMTGGRCSCCYGVVKKKEDDSI